jgi:DNA primase catalytic core
MARIPEEEIAELKRNVPLAELCRQRGLVLEPHGSKDVKCRCPFHDDKEASFIVTPEKNLFHCMGCGAGGSVIDLVMKMDGLSFRHAVEVLRTNPAALTGTEPVRCGSVRKLESPLSLDADDHEIMRQTIGYYQETLLKSGNAMTYLQERGLKHPDMIGSFRLGYADRTLGYRLPAKNRKTGEEIRTRLQKLGILRESGHEHLTGCIVFPVFNDAGQVTEIYGRRIASGGVRRAPKHLYLRGPHQGVWNAAAVKQAREWILCESIIDALSLWVHGFTHVTASYGARGFTPDHWALLRAVKPERVVIAYDNDEAGNSAANELAQRLEPEGIAAWRVELPPNTDVNDVLKSAEDPQAILSSFVARAVRLLPDVAAPLPPPRSPYPKPAAPVEAAPPVAVETSTVPAPAAPLPSTPAGALRPSEDGNQAEMTRGEREYRVRGLAANTSFDHLKVNLRLKFRDKFHLDTFDLYAARARAAFTAAGNAITGVHPKEIEEDLSILIAQIERAQEEKIFEKMKAAEKKPAMTAEEEQKALALLRDPRLFERILADFETAGTVGEEMNKLIGYLVAVSRKLDDPLSAIVISRSAAGKSALLNAILAFVPDEDKEVLTAMTAQALFYLPSDGLQHKVLAVVEDEGGQQAAYPMKILQSEKVLVLAVTVKDPDGGLPQTKLKKVEGPVAQLMTSTQAELDYELANRYLVLTVDEEREQTRRIHEAQREAETLTGLLRKIDRDNILKAHHNAQRLLRPLRVVNPFAQLLTFPDDRLRLRRDHQKYLSLIRAVAFLRQYQKPIKSCEHRGQAIQYIEVDEDDIRLAHPLAAHVLGRCLDELAPPTRAFLLQVHEVVDRIAAARVVKPAALRLTQRQLREETGWSDTQVRRYLTRLVELEYLISHRVPGTGARFEYELVYDGQGRDGKPFVPGLAELGTLLRRQPAAKKDESPPVRPAIAAGSPSDRRAQEPSLSSLLAAS